MKTFLETKVADSLGIRETAGQLGVEIEMEGDPTRGSEGFTGWNILSDGSLRGPGAREFVFRKPETLVKAKERVNSLYQKINDSGGRISDSMRAGVHVHLNCQDLTIKQLMTLLTCYYIYEDCICHRFGEHREGNFFCFRLSDTEYVNQVIRRFLASRDGLFHFDNDAIRYSALNLNALTKFGSIEFRSMQTPTTAQPIIDWIDLIYALKENSKQFNDPLEVMQMVSADGHEEFANRLFGNHARSVINVPDFENKVYNGARNIQFWVFTTNWESK